MKDLQKNPFTRMLVWCIAHFIIDFTCIALLSLRLTDQNTYSLILYAVIYNGFAFAFQLPVGAFADLFGTHGRLTAIGCFAVSIGLFISSPLLMCIVIGCGNAMFHVGAAGQILPINKNRAANIGFFVAPGAIGVFLGAKFHNINELIWISGACLILLGIFTIYPQKENTKSTVTFTSKKVLCLIFLFSTVLLRAYIGNILKYPFMNSFGIAFMFILCVFGGKLIGGICVDKFGMFRFNVIAQSIGIILLILSTVFSVTAFSAILLFNTTMATTAYLMYKCFPRYPATTFGLTTLALYIGTLPAILKIGLIDATPVSVTILGILSTVFLLTGIKCGEKTL